ncbi:unnamed protein product [Pedinophyceae sp. YPF-701]|nr:unnamed protein product [Pedinophyceae sp. YPF-701]
MTSNTATPLGGHQAEPVDSSQAGSRFVVTGMPAAPRARGVYEDPLDEVDGDWSENFSQTLVLGPSITRAVEEYRAAQNERPQQPPPAPARRPKRPPDAAEAPLSPPPSERTSNAGVFASWQVPGAANAHPQPPSDAKPPVPPMTHLPAAALAGTAPSDPRGAAAPPPAPGEAATASGGDMSLSFSLPDSPTMREIARQLCATEHSGDDDWIRQAIYGPEGSGGVGGVAPGDGGGGAGTTSGANDSAGGSEGWNAGVAALQEYMEGGGVGEGEWAFGSRLGGGWVVPPGRPVSFEVLPNKESRKLSQKHARRNAGVLLAGAGVSANGLRERYNHLLDDRIPQELREQGLTIKTPRGYFVRALVLWMVEGLPDVVLEQWGLGAAATLRAGADATEEVIQDLLPRARGGTTRYEVGAKLQQAGLAAGRMWPGEAAAADEDFKASIRAIFDQGKGEIRADVRAGAAGM